MIKELAYGFNNQQYLPPQAAHAWILLVYTKQQNDENLTAHYKQFVSVVERIERAHGPIEPIAVVLKYSKYDAKKKNEIVKKCHKQMLTIMFMEKVNHRFKCLLCNLDSDYALSAG